jgi:uncharacterized protein
MSGPTDTSSGGSGPGRRSVAVVRLGRWFRVLFPIHSSPRRIALGVSIGVLIAFSPSIGFQMGLALVIASVFNASRLAAVGCVWITNPLTMGPVFAFTYAVGRPFWFGSLELSLSELSRTIGGGYSPVSVGAVFHAFESIYNLGAGVIVPMLIGGLIVGGVVGGLCYIPTKSIASSYQRAVRRRSRAVRRREGVSAGKSAGYGRTITVIHADTEGAPPTRRAA